MGIRILVDKKFHGIQLRDTHHPFLHMQKGSQNRLFRELISRTKAKQNVKNEIRRVITSNNWIIGLFSSSVVTRLDLHFFDASERKPVSKTLKLAAKNGLILLVYGRFDV